MPDGTEAIAIKVVSSLSDVDQDQWDDCAGRDNPFVMHGFLSALEDSGSCTAETGWSPRHLIIEDGGGALIACAPLYLKNHSYGEYVFDWGWADAYERAGGRYYPKLQCSVPFTPATGPRLMTHPDLAHDRRDELQMALAAGMIQFAKNAGVSSIHVTFPPQSQFETLGRMGYLTRIGQQFHWENRGYGSFDDFLGELSSRKRKNIRKERKAVENSGLDIHVLEGSDIQPRHWEAFYRFYLDTTGKKWGHDYLKEEFFPLMAERMKDRIVLIVAERGGLPVAGALNLKGNDTLFGRNWGCLEDYKFLHFEVCYYQGVDYAIRHGLKWVEAGAQGPHKVQRGYLPRATYSAHWIADPSLRDAIEHFLTREKTGVEFEMRELAKASPYRSTENDKNG